MDYKLSKLLIDKWKTFIYKPETKNIYWGKLIFISVGMIFLTIMVFNGYKKTRKMDKEREKYARYTIGYTTGYNNNIKSSYTGVDYTYYVEGKEYKTTGQVPYTENFSVKKEGGRYYVQYASNDISNSDFLYKYPVPDSIGASPDSGWSYMPGYENAKP